MIPVVVIVLLCIALVCPVGVDVFTATPGALCLLSGLETVKPHLVISMAFRAHSMLEVAMFEIVHMMICIVTMLMHYYIILYIHTYHTLTCMRICVYVLHFG